MAVSSDLQERCTRCVLPRTATSLEFDRNGLCGVCASQQSQSSPTIDDSSKKAEELEKRIARIKEDGQGRSYDCIVGLSGGRDSSYLLHELTRKHHLRCLAVYYRTPFTPQAIHENVLRMVDKLNTPLRTMDLSVEFHQKIARKMVVLWATKKKWMYANLACAQCKLLNGEIFRIAKKNKISWLVYGSKSLESFQGASWRQSSEDSAEGTADRRFTFKAQMNRMMTIIKKGAELMIFSPELWRHLWLMFQASILYLTPDTPYLKLRYPGIHVLHYFYYAGWREADCEQALKELGWEIPFGTGTTWRADCSLAAFKDYMFNQTVGMSYYESLLSNMIRQGMVTRDEALARLEVEKEVFPKKIKHALDVMNLPDDLPLPNLPSGNSEKSESC